MIGSISNSGFDILTTITKGQPWCRWTGVKLHATVVSIVAVLFFLVESPSAILVLGGILCTPMYLLLGIMEGRNAPLWFSPLSFYFLWYSVGLGLSAIYLGIVVASGEPLSFSVVLVAPEYLGKGYVIYLVGSVALHAGLQWFRPTFQEEAKVRHLNSGRWMVLSLMVLLVIGLWAGWKPEWIAPLGAPGRILPWLSIGALCAFALMPREWFGLSRIAFVMILVVGIAGQFTVNLMSGSKAFLMFSFFPLVWLYVVRRPLRRWLPIFALVLLVFYFVVVAPIVTLARYLPGQRSETAAERILRVFQGERPAGADYLPNTFYLDQVRLFLHRQFDPYPLGFLVDDVKSNGLQHGSTMDYVVYAFIPRILWPDKPDITRGGWFATYLGFSPSEEEATVAIGITATGELYWNFGVLGVLVGMFTIGCL